MEKKNSYLSTMDLEKKNFDTKKEQSQNVFLSEEYMDACSSEELYKIITTIEALFKRIGYYEPVLLESLKKAMEETKRFAPIYYVNGAPLNPTIYQNWYAREEQKHEGTYREYDPNNMPVMVYKSKRTR